MKKIIPLLFVFISCTHRITEYDLIYIDLNREHLDRYREYFSVIKLSKSKDSISYRIANNIYELSNAEDSINTFKFYKTTISNPGSSTLGNEFISDFRLDNLALGDTIDKVFAFDRNNEKLVKYKILVSRRKIDNYDIFTFGEYSGSINNKNDITIDYFEECAYISGINLLYRDIRFQDYSFVGKSNPVDTFQLVEFRKSGMKKWTRVFNPDSTYWEKLNGKMEK